MSKNARIGEVRLTRFTLLLTLVQTAEQVIIVRLLTGLAGGFAVFAPFPIATELMPARHRLTFSAVYEVALACSFAVLPLVGRLLADSPNAFWLMALPSGLVLFVTPALIYFLDPGKPALVFAQRPCRGGGRYRQPDHPWGRQLGFAASACNAWRQYAGGA